MRGEFGFLCMSICLESKYVRIHEKESWTAERYKHVLEKTGGIVPYDRAPKRIYDCPRNYIIEGDFISQEHIHFVVSCLSIVFGVKLVSQKFSYIDNTNIKPLHIGLLPCQKENMNFF